MKHKLTETEKKEIKRVGNLWCERNMFDCPYRDNSTIDECLHPDTMGKTCSEITICPAWRDKK